MPTKNPLLEHDTAASHKKQLILHTQPRERKDTLKTSPARPERRFETRSLYPRRAARQAIRSATMLTAIYPPFGLA